MESAINTRLRTIEEGIDAINGRISIFERDVAKRLVVMEAKPLDQSHRTEPIEFRHNPAGPDGYITGETDPQSIVDPTCNLLPRCPRSTSGQHDWCLEIRSHQVTGRRCNYCGKSQTGTISWDG